MSQPLAPSVRPSLSNYPSAVSTTIPSKEGGTKVVGGCNRYQWYRRTGIPATDPGNVNWELSARIGDYYHELLSDLVDEYGFQLGLQRISKENSIYDSLINLSGRSDLLLWDHHLGEPIGVEIKSVGDWKSKKCLETPSVEHVMQSMLYLHYYKEHIPADQKAPDRWYIWYIARSENWELKGRKNVSPFTQIWDFYVTLDDGHAVVHTPTGIKHWKDITIQGIWKRYEDLDEKVKSGLVPDRDYQLKYSEERIAGMHKLGLLEFKKDQAVVEKWLKKGGKEGELQMDLGDFECRACSHKSLCWGLPQTYEAPNFSLPPKKEEKKGSKVSSISPIL
jgi:hypothetical protein